MQRKIGGTISRLPKLLPQHGKKDFGLRETHWERGGGVGQRTDSVIVWKGIPHSEIAQCGIPISMSQLIPFGNVGSVWVVTGEQKM